MTPYSRILRVNFNPFLHKIKEKWTSKTTPILAISRSLHWSFPTKFNIPWTSRKIYLTLFSWNFKLSCIPKLLLSDSTEGQFSEVRWASQVCILPEVIVALLLITADILWLDLHNSHQPPLDGLPHKPHPNDQFWGSLAPKHPLICDFKDLEEASKLALNPWNLEWSCVGKLYLSARPGIGTCQSTCGCHITHATSI